MAEERISPWKRLFVDTWLQELLAIIVSMLAYVAILILFVLYDGKADFQWHGLTLNATVSALSTTSRLLLLITLSSCIGQLRWNTFARQQTPISYMSSGDSASRGVLGCFGLLWETRSCSVAAIGAWLTILAVAFEPSIQQALRFANDFKETPSGGGQVAEISSALSWAGGRLEGDSAQLLVGPDGRIVEYLAVDLEYSMTSAMYSGLGLTPAQVLQQTPFTCSSGHCEWEPYTSLAICSACYDVSDEVVVKQAKASDKLHTFNYYWSNFDGIVANFTGSVYMLPNKLAIWNTPGLADQALITTKSTSRWSDTLRFKKNDTLIFAISMLKYSSSSTKSPGSPQIMAHECGLYFCLKSYKSRVLNGTLSEETKEVSSTMDPSSFLPKDTSTESTSPGILYDQDTYVSRTDMRVLPPTANTSAFSPDDFKVSQPGAAGLVTEVTSIFNKSNVNYGVLPMNISIGGGARNTSKFGTVFSPASLQSLYESQDINQTFANLANTMTNDMRRSGRTTQIQKGTVGLPITKVHIRWGWVAFSAVLIVVGTVFLLVSILLTRKVAVPLWKTSALAMLFHQLRPSPHIDASSRPTVSEMENMVQGMSAKLGEYETLEVTPTIRRRKQTRQDVYDHGTADVHSKSLLSASPGNQDLEQADEASNIPIQIPRIPRKPVPTSRAMPAYQDYSQHVDIR